MCQRTFTWIPKTRVFHWNIVLQPWSVSGLLLSASGFNVVADDCMFQFILLLKQTQFVFQVPMFDEKSGSGSFIPLLWDKNVGQTLDLQVCFFSFPLVLQRDQYEPRGGIVVIPHKLQLMKMVYPLITLCVWGCLCAVSLFILLSAVHSRFQKKNCTHSESPFLFSLFFSSAASNSLGWALPSHGRIKCVLN